MHKSLSKLIPSQNKQLQLALVDYYKEADKEVDQEVKEEIVQAAGLQEKEVLQKGLNGVKKKTQME